MNLSYNYNFKKCWPEVDVFSIEKLHHQSIEKQQIKSVNPLDIKPRDQTIKNLPLDVLYKIFDDIEFLTKSKCSLVCKASVIYFTEQQNIHQACMFLFKKALEKINWYVANSISTPPQKDGGLKETLSDEYEITGKKTQQKVFGKFFNEVMKICPNSHSIAMVENFLKEKNAYEIAVNALKKCLNIPAEMVQSILSRHENSLTAIKDQTCKGKLGRIFARVGDLGKAFQIAFRLDQVAFQQEFLKVLSELYIKFILIHPEKIKEIIHVIPRDCLLYLINSRSIFRYQKAAEVLQLAQQRLLHFVEKEKRPLPVENQKRFVSCLMIDGYFRSGNLEKTLECLASLDLDDHYLIKKEFPLKYLLRVAKKFKLSGKKDNEENIKRCIIKLINKFNKQKTDDLIIAQIHSLIGNIEYAQKILNECIEKNLDSVDFAKALFVFAKECKEDQFLKYLENVAEQCKKHLKFSLKNYTSRKEFFKYSLIALDCVECYLEKNLKNNAMALLTDIESTITSYVKSSIEDDSPYSYFRIKRSKLLLKRALIRTAIDPNINQESIFKLFEEDALDTPEKTLSMLKFVRTVKRKHP